MPKRHIVPLAFASVVLGGCVSGPSAYFKSVSEETALARQQTTQTTKIEPVTVEPIQSAALAPPTTTDAVPTANLADQRQPETNSDLPGLETITSTKPVIANSADAPIALLPQFSAPNQNQQSLQSAYATQDPLAGPSGLNQPSGSFAIGLASEPLIDPLEAAAEARIPLLYSSIKHGQCKRGRGPRPKKISATNINPGDPYYIEIRMRHTPLLPVGHTYVAYGRLSASGQILDEKLIMLAPVGGYAGAALASGIPMPGILDPHPDDCRIRPETAYRVSLNAQRYEKLLLEVQKARQERPSYLLFAYNCNHFMTRMAQSVGIKPPKNIYVPALEYIYAMIEENEGRKISRF